MNELIRIKRALSMNELIRRRRFWYLDILKTETWLNEMHLKGYALRRANLKKGQFAFKKAEPEPYFYRICREKENGSIDNFLSEGYFNEVCLSNNYYIMKTANEKPPLSPSYNAFLEKNIKRKYITGMSLLIYSTLFILFAIVFIAAFIAFLFSELEYGGLIGVSVITAVFSIPVWLLAFHFKKLGKVKKSLEAVCEKSFELDFTIPRNTIPSKAELKKMKEEKRYIKKLKLLWFYSPDKTEKWLETMEEKGFNLIRMSKIGNTFYFNMGLPRKVKYHIDYQNKITSADYFSMHKDNGWQLYFTSVTRVQSFNVWGQEYTDTIPEFYSEKADVAKHAKRIALTYSLTFLPVCLAYTALLIWYVIIFATSGELAWPLLPVLILYPFVMLELGFISIKTILYFFRVKKSITNK